MNVGRESKRAVSPSTGVTTITLDDSADEKLPAAPASNTALQGKAHCVKRERSDDEESTQRRVAQRPNDEPEVQLSLAKLVLGLLRNDDVAILEKAVPQLLFALHEKENDKRLKKQQDFYQVGGHLAVVTAMTKYLDSKLLQQSGIIVLLHASYRNEVLRAAIGQVQGIQAILKAMKRFGTERDVVFQGLQALVNLMSEKPNAELLVNSLQGIPFILAKMKEFEQDGDILRWACELLKRLCRFNRLRNTIFEANAIETLASVLNQHKDNKKIQKAAREAMKLLL